jgi:Na+:H+ antiporter, NhaA family
VGWSVAGKIYRLSRRRRVVEYIIEHSLVLALGALIALVWANVAFPSYERVAAFLEFPVNDVGMVFFFAMATKEVVEATAPGGALHTWRRAAMPVVAAVGGMAAPAIIYLLVARASGAPELFRGWAIPCATDIAFSFLVAKGIFRRHSAIPFLLLLAIADDALGLVILALFYPVGDLHLPTAVMVMAAAIAVAYGLRRARVRSYVPYVVAGGVLSWVALFRGGLHPALALVPIVPFLPHAARDPGLFVEATPGARDALSQFERSWKHPVQAVLFLFGLANAGVPIHEIGIGTWPVVTGLLIGKPIGITLAVALALVSGLKLPHGIDWRDMAVVGCAAGIGFTVALFFATASFPAGAHLDQAKLGALLSVGSAVLALAAAAVLRVGRFSASPAAGL